MSHGGFVRYVEFRRPQVLAGGHDLSKDAGWEFVNHCREEWKFMSEEEKEKFSVEALLTSEDTQRNWRPSSNPYNKEAPLEIPKPSFENSADSDAEKRELVTNIFQTPEDWKSKPIVVCSFTLYVDPGQDSIYLPAEIGLTAMTLKDGVIDNYARIINSKSIPRGYAKQFLHSVEELGLPSMLKLKELEKNSPFMPIVKSFLQKYNPEEDIFYVYAFDSDMKMVHECFQLLFESSGVRFPLKVLNLGLYAYLASTNTRNKVPGNSRLVVSTHREKGKPMVASFKYPEDLPLCRYGMFVTDTEVENAVKEGDNFQNIAEISCIYHVEQKTRFKKCALHISNRYAYSLLEILTLSNDVVPVAGGHYPEIEKPLVEKDRRYHWLYRWGLTVLERPSDFNQPSNDNNIKRGLIDAVTGVRQRGTTKRRRIPPMDNPFRPLPPDMRPKLVRDGAGIGPRPEIRRDDARVDRSQQQPIRVVAPDVPIHL